MESEPIITFENVGVAFGEEQIYDRLSFDVRHCEFVCILGPSGFGKSTLLRMIGGLLELNSGRVIVDGRAPRDAWSEIAFVFQSPRLAVDPRLLILDDALSSVDTATEEAILGELTRVRRDRTCLIVAHRVSTVRDSDVIFVLDGGRIVERGSHVELVAHGGFYAELHRKQLLEEELEAIEEDDVRA